MKCEHLYLLRIVTELLVVLYELEFLLCSFEICNNYVEPLLKNLGLLNGHDLYHIKILKFYYKLVHSELPSYFNRYLPVFRNEKMHDHGYTLRPVVQWEIFSCGNASMALWSPYRYRGEGGCPSEWSCIKGKNPCSNMGVYFLRY